MTVNNHCLPIADTGNCTEGVTVTVIGVTDNPPATITTTSINPDDSEPTNCGDANSTLNTTSFRYAYEQTNKFLLVVSIMTPTALSLLPAVIAGARDGNTFKVKSNSSRSSTILSIIIGTLTLLIVIPLANVAVSVVVLKSSPPAGQIFSAHIMINLPSADTGDYCDGVIVTLNG